LRSAREAAGLSLALAADRLHCDPNVLAALEQGQFAQVGAAVFVRGHIRRYADMLGENGAELAEQWAQQDFDASHQLPDLTRIAQAPRRTDPLPWRNAAIGVGVAVLIALAAWLILSGRLGL
jgi:cytoskeleton protein RodZ